MSLSWSRTRSGSPTVDDCGIQYIEGGWPGSNPKDVSFFKDIKKEKLSQAKIAAFGSTRRAKITAPTRTRTSAPWSQSEAAGRHHRRQDLGPPVPRGARDPARREPGDDRRLGGVPEGARARGLLRRRALLRRLQAQPRYALRTLQAAADGGRRLDRPVRHQRRHACPTRSPSDRRQSAETIGVAARHPHPQRLRAGRRQHAGGRGAGRSQVQGTINGFGERCGNADLCS